MNRMHARRIRLISAVSGKIISGRFCLSVEAEGADIAISRID